MKKTLLILALVAATAAAQTSTLSCNANAGVPPLLRSEGRTELVGDIVIECTSSAAVTIAGTLEVRLNTKITSKRVGNKTEVLLLVDEPGLRRADGKPELPPTFGVNVFQGIALADDRVAFPNLLLQASKPGELLTLRITNVRADASALGMNGSILHLIHVNSIINFEPAGVLPINGAAQTVGYSLRGLDAAIKGAGPADSGRTSLPICTSNNVGLLTPGAQSGTIDMVLRFKEGFNTAFRPRNSSDERLPGQVFSDESGFMNSTFPATDGLKEAGVATNGTQLMATFSNVPPGVALYVTRAPVAVSRDLKLRMLNGGSGTTSPVPLVNGTGSVTWEVEEVNHWSLESVDFGLLVGYRANTLQPVAINVHLGLAPQADTAIPNFLAAMATLQTIPLYTCGGTLPDLVVQAITGIKDIPTGTAMRPSIVLRNQGASASGPFYYSMDLENGERAVISARERVSQGIPANTSIVLRPSIPLPLNFPTGTYGLHVKTDTSREVTELLEDNNARLEFPEIVCGERLTTSSLVVNASGGTNFLPVQASCIYRASTATPWITIQGDRVTFQPNPTRETRRGSIGISSRTTLPVVQAYLSPSCTLTLNKSSIEIPETGGAETISLAASSPDCEWRAASNDWLQVYPSGGTGSAQLQMTVFPNFTSMARPGQLIVGNTSVHVSQRSNNGSEDRRLVQQIYFNFFGRLPTEAEIALQAGELGRGISRAELIDRFMNTPEFNLGGRFIAGLYVGLLARDAEYGGWLFQRNALSTSLVTQTQLVKNFLETREWELTFGSPTDAEFVKLLYRNVLLREGAPAEIAFHEGTLRNGSLTRVALATNFLNTAEFRMGTGSRLTSFLLYATLLNRDAIGYEFYLTRRDLDNGATVRSRLELIAESYEFLRLLE